VLRIESLIAEESAVAAAAGTAEAVEDAPRVVYTGHIRGFNEAALSAEEKRVSAARRDLIITAQMRPNMPNALFSA
jgi:hypothetical protein